MVMDNNDFYQILGITKSANSIEIKKAYCKKVLQYHPDKNKNIEAPEMFQKIQIAYETLSDSTKRDKYDSFDNLQYNIEIKNMFMYYQELIIELCNKYQISDKQKEELVMLFNPSEYNEELKNNDIINANKKMYQKITEYVSSIFWKKISDNAMLTGLIGFVVGWLNGST